MIFTKFHPIIGELILYHTIPRRVDEDEVVAVTGKERYLNTWYVIAHDCMRIIKLV